MAADPPYAQQTSVNEKKRDAFDLLQIPEAPDGLTLKSVYLVD